MTNDHKTHTDDTTINEPEVTASGDYPGNNFSSNAKDTEDLPSKDVNPDELQDARLRDLERQVVQLTQRLGVQQQRQQQEMANFMHLLGTTLVQQAQQIQAGIVYPTAIMSVPDEEEDNGGTVLLTLNEGQPALYREEDGELKRFYPAGVDSNALKHFIEQRQTSGAPSSPMYRVNIYLDR